MVSGYYFAGYEKVELDEEINRIPISPGVYPSVLSNFWTWVYTFFICVGIPVAIIAHDAYKKHHEAAEWRAQQSSRQSKQAQDSDNIIGIEYIQQLIERQRAQRMSKQAHDSSLDLKSKQIYNPNYLSDLEKYLEKQTFRKSQK